MIENQNYKNLEINEMLDKVYYILRWNEMNIIIKLELDILFSLLGFATQERQSRSMQIKMEFRNSLAESRMANRRSRSASVLRIAFEDARLTQCDFYCTSTSDAICGCSLHVHTCTYALTVVVKFYSTHIYVRRYLHSVHNFNLD